MRIRKRSSLPPASTSNTRSVGILAQPVGEHAAGGAGADDDVVVVQGAYNPTVTDFTSV